MLISLENINKTFVEKQILNNISLYINKKDRIGIIGENGSGKSTLLKIMAKVEEADSGIVTYDPDIKVNYLSQSIDFDIFHTISDEINQRLEKKDAKIYEIKSLLGKFGIYDFTKQIGQLSGGEKRKLSICLNLVSEADCLIIDEITNHLDIETINWLESYLNKYNGAIVMVTHDRYFLERVTNIIMEIESGKIETYPGNYSRYLELKELKEIEKISHERKRQAFLRREYEWIKRGPQARSTKDKKRISNYEKVAAIQTINQKDLKIKSNNKRLGKKTIILDNVSKSYNGKTLIKDFSYIVDLDARIGVIGENGSGKTTLLKILSGMIKPDDGTVEIGETVRVGYLLQENEVLPEDMRVYDFIKSIALEFTIEGEELSITELLENFLFDKSMQYTFINRLSGGEKRRLQLLSVLATSPNILLFDEPTNDLDITTLSILEEYIEKFKGPVIIVSHDRFHLDKVVDEILYLGENGIVGEFLGNFSQYLDSAESKRANAGISWKNKNKEKQIKVKLSFNEQKEFSAIESEIFSIEEKLKQIQNDISDNFNDYQKFKIYDDQRIELEKHLEQKIERWEYLSSIDEQSKKKF